MAGQGCEPGTSFSFRPLSATLSYIGNNCLYPNHLKSLKLCSILVFQVKQVSHFFTVQKLLRQGFPQTHTFHTHRNFWWVVLCIFWTNILALYWTPFCIKSLQFLILIVWKTVLFVFSFLQFKWYEKPRTYCWGEGGVATFKSQKLVIYMEIVSLLLLWSTDCLGNL